MNNKTNTDMEEKGNYKKTSAISSIVNLNVFSSSFWIGAAGIGGSTVIAWALAIYDTSLNTMAIGLLFKPRVGEVIGNNGSYAMGISLGISFFISAILCFAIILTSIKAKKQSEGITEEFRQKMESWSKRLIWVSGFVSFIGFIIFITPPDATLKGLLSINYFLQLMFGSFLSFIPSMLSKIFSEDISYYISQSFNNVIKSIDKETVSAIQESAEEELRNENTTNLHDDFSNPFKVTKRTGTNG